MRDAASRLGAALCFALLGAALFAATSSAAFLHEGGPSGHFGADGTEASEINFIHSGGLAIDQEGRRLYALERIEGGAYERSVRIDAFDLANSHLPVGGNFPVEVPEGPYGEITLVMAVDNSGGPADGNIYYTAASYGNSFEKGSVIYGFNSAGEPLKGQFPLEVPRPVNACGIAVDADGHLWVDDMVSHSLREYTSDGIPMPNVVKLAADQPQACTFAFDMSTDDLYVDGREFNSGTFYRYTAKSNYTEAIPLDPGNVGYDEPVNVDSTHHVVYVGNRAYSPDGVLLEQGNYSGYSALDEQTGTIYASEGIRIYPATSSIPDVHPGGFHGTTVEAEIDPVGGGEVTGCTFEYGTNTNFGNSVPCSQPTPFSGPESVSVELPVTPEVLYHYRATATNSHGTNVGEARTFVPHHVVDLKTEPADNLTKHEATLNASYTGTGEDTHYYFEWGSTTAYGNLTAAPPGVDDGTQTGPEAISAPITGLQPDSIYHFRVVASNAQGTSVAEDETFETAHAVTGLTTSISDLTGSTVTLNATWTGDATQTNYYFEWGATTVYGNRTASPPGADGGSGTGPQEFHVALTGLAPLSYYHYRLVASNPSGTTVTADAVFRTPQLAAVSYLPPLKLTTSSAELTGKINPQETGPTTFHFDYGADNSYGLSTPESGPVGSDNSFHPVSAEIEGLEPGQTYHYRLVATSPTGTERGPDRTVTTIPNPPTITDTSSSDLGPAGVTLNASVRPGFGPTVVYFQYGPVAGYGSFTHATDPLPGDDTDHQVSIHLGGLVANSTYHFRAVAINFASVVYGPDRTFTTPGPPEVVGGGVTTVGQFDATVGASVDPHLIPTTYHFEYGLTVEYGGVTAESGSIGADESFHPVIGEFHYLLPGTTYHYRVVAKNELGSAVGPDQVLTTNAAPIVEERRLAPKCSKGRVRRHGKCVKKPRRKHRWRHGKTHRGREQGNA